MASNSDIFRQMPRAVDTVDVIGEHLAFKRAGRELKGRCPFHDDYRQSMPLSLRIQMQNGSNVRQIGAV